MLVAPTHRFRLPVGGCVKKAQGQLDCDLTSITAHGAQVHDAVAAGHVEMIAEPVQVPLLEDLHLDQSTVPKSAQVVTDCGDIQLQAARQGRDVLG